MLPTHHVPPSRRAAVATRMPVTPPPSGPSPVSPACPAPEIAGLAWLLGLGLSREEMHGSTTQALGPSGEAVRDPVLAQSWQVAQNCFAKPARPPEEALRDRVRVAAAGMLRDGFKAHLKVVSAPPGAPVRVRRAAFQKAMATTYLLGLPIGYDMARHLPMVEQWTPQQVFGRSAGQLVALLQGLRADTLAKLGVARMSPGKARDDTALAARDFHQYVDECIVNVGEMRLPDGSRPHPLPPALQAYLQRLADAIKRAKAEAKAQA